MRGGEEGEAGGDVGSQTEETDEGGEHCGWVTDRGAGTVTGRQRGERGRERSCQVVEAQRCNLCGRDVGETGEGELGRETKAWEKQGSGETRDFRGGTAWNWRGLGEAPRQGGDTDLGEAESTLP